MSAFDEGVAVLKIAAAMGNEPSRAVLAELEFRQTRIDALHEANGKLQEITSDLNGQLRELRLQALRWPAGFDRLFNGDFAPGVTKANPIHQGAE